VRQPPLVSGPAADPARLSAEVRARLIPLVTDDAARIYSEAEARWPVRTGKSKAGLFLRDESSGDLIVIRIGNTVDYARFIRSLKVGTKSAGDWRPVLTRELGDPVRASRRTLPSRAADVAAAALTDLLG
jgi:hypothetical protein